MILKLKQDLIKVDTRVENLDFFASNESYTEDKNKIYLCLKDNKGVYYDYNMLMHVSLHELAHAFTNVIDKSHTTPEFNNKFKELIDKATSLGLYDDTKPKVPHYCGIEH